MYTYVNTNRQKEVIKKKFTDAIEMLNNDDPLIFFNVIDFIGSFISSLFNTNVYSATDCFNTVKSIELLFDIKKHKTFNIKIQDIKQFDKIFNLKNNIFYSIILVSEGLPPHTFSVIKYENNWFMIQSFASVCELHIIEDDNLIDALKKYFMNPTIAQFNYLFQTKIPDLETKIPNVDFTVSYTIFEKLPIQQLKLLLENFIKL